MSYEAQIAKQKKLLVVIIAIVIIVAFGATAIRQVDAGHRGVLLTFGKVEEQVYAEGGPYFVIPFVQEMILVNVQTLKYLASASAASEDLQIVSSSIAVNFHVDPSQANSVYQRLRFDYGDRVIAPAIQEVVKAATAKFVAEELITKREEVKAVITDDLTIRLANFGIVVETVLIESFDFSAGFNLAIEAKVTAEQQALEAERILQRKEVEALQRIAEAGGVAESIRITAEAEADAILLKAKANAEALNIQKQEVTTLINQFKAIEKWDGKLPQFLGTEVIPFIDITNVNATAP